MTAIIYQYNEPPLILDDVEEILISDGGTVLEITNHEGLTTVGLEDIIRVELTK